MLKSGTFDILISRCAVRRIDLSLPTSHLGWSWSFETTAWILATKVDIERDGKNGLPAMIRRTSGILSQLIESWEDSTAQELDGEDKTSHFIMDLWKGASGVVIANNGVEWVIDKLVEGENPQMGERDAAIDITPGGKASHRREGVDMNLPVNDSDILPILAWLGKDILLRSFINERQVDLNTESELFGLPLFAAVLAGHSKTTSLLIEMGARMNEYNKFGETCLTLAIIDQRFPEIVKVLLSAGVDVNLRDRENLETALITSVTEDAEDMAQLLLKSENVNVTLKDRKTYAALHHACERGHVNIVRSLLENEAIDANDPGDSRTPLDIALNYNNADVVELLLNKGVDVNAVHGRRDSAASRARSYKKENEESGREISREIELIVEYCDARGIAIA